MNKKVIILTLLLIGIVFADSGLVSEWHLDEGSSTIINDTSGNSRNGTITGATWNASAKFGSGLQFNGTTDYVNFGNILDFGGTSTFSVESWINMRSPTITNSFIVSRYNAGIIGQWILEVSNTSYPIFHREVGPYTIQSNESISNNAWYHIAATYDGSTMRLYVNGLIKNSTASGSMASTGNEVIVGAGRNVNSPAFFFNGTIDEVKIYDRALSDIEVLAHSNCDYNQSTGAAWTISNKNVFCRGKINITNDVNITQNANFTLDAGTLNVSGNFNITSGLFNASDATVNITGITYVFGTFRGGNASISIHSGVSIANYGLQVLSTGTYHGGTSVNVIGSIYVDTGTLNLTKGKTILNSMHTTGTSMRIQSTQNIFHNNGSFDLTYNGNTLFELYTGGTTAFYNFTKSGTGGLWLYTNVGTDSMAVANIFNLSTGTMLLQFGGQPALPLILNGTSHIYGTLNPSSTIVTARGETYVYSGGVFGNNSAWTLNASGQNMFVYSGGRYLGGNGYQRVGGIDNFGLLNFSSNYTLFDRGGLGGNPSHFIFEAGGNISHNNGTVTICCGSGYDSVRQNTSLYNLNITISGGDAVILTQYVTGGTLSMAGNLTVGAVTGITQYGNTKQVDLLVNGTTWLNGSLTPADSSVFTFNGPITINSGGTLGANANYTLNQSGILTVSSGATFNAPNSNGLWEIRSPTTGAVFSANSGSTFNHNGGKLIAVSGEVRWAVQNGAFFNDIWCKSTASICVNQYSPFKVIRNLTNDQAGNGFRNVQFGNSYDIMFGNSTTSGFVVNNGNYYFNDGGTGQPQLIRLMANSSAFPWNFTGNGIVWGTAFASVKKYQLENGNYYPNYVTANGGSHYILNGTIFLNGSFTVNTTDSFNSSQSNLTVYGISNMTGTNMIMNDTIINAMSTFAISGEGNFTLTNVTFTNNTPVVSGSANLTVRWRNIKVIDETGAALSGAVANVTQTGTTVTGTTGSDGIIQAIVEDYQSIGGTVTLKNIVLNASKATYLNNAFTDNMTSSERTIVLAPSGGATSGYNNGTAIIGTPISTTITPSVKVNGLTLKGPWQGLQNVSILDSSSNVVVNFTHNFSEGGLSLSYLKLDSGAAYAGVSGSLFTLLSHFNKTFTLNVPIRDAVCNTQVCIGQVRTKDTDCSSTDWSTTTSTRSGNVCLAAVSGTVVRDQADLTSIVSVPELDFVWIILIFIISFGVFARLKNE